MLTLESETRRERTRGLYTLSSIARRLGLVQQRLDYHKRKGFIPSPAAKEGSRYYYTEPQIEIIREYFFGTSV